MAKRIYYTYNPTTDNFERYYMSFRGRMWVILRYVAVGIVIACIVLAVLYLIFGYKNDNYTKRENRVLKEEIKVLQRRVNEGLSVMNDIRKRDDNFYRVLLGMNPMSQNVRYAGMNSRPQPETYQSLSNPELLNQLNQKVDLFERQLYAQSVSFDELRSEALKQKDKINHIPAIIPLKKGTYTISSGYGYRVDPWVGGTRFHTGIDFVIEEGSPVYATATGTIEKAETEGTDGLFIVVDHGFNYKSIYSHLSSSEVKEGDQIKRGEVLGFTGNSGRSLAPHLHYEVRFKDEAVDPVNYYFLDITPEQYRDFLNSANNAGNMLD